MATYKSYILGFLGSLAMVLGAYSAVVNHEPHALIIIFSLAIVQAFLQLFLFLHIHEGESAGVNWVFIFFTFVVLIIIVGGSLWIMNNLNYRMTPDQMTASMIDQAE